MNFSKFHCLADMRLDKEYSITKEICDITKTFLDINEENFQKSLKEIQEFLSSHNADKFISFLLLILPQIRFKKKKVALLLYDSLDLEYITDLKRDYPLYLEYYSLKEKSDPIDPKDLKYLVTFYEDNSLQLIIYNDDIELLQQHVLNQNDFNFDQTVEIEPMCFDQYAMQTVSLILFAIFYGSLKCFKYLLINNAQLDNDASEFAVISGNSDIIHILEQKGLLFHNLLKESVIFHRYDIFDWLLLNYNEDILDKPFYSSIVYFNSEVSLFYLLNGYKFYDNQILYDSILTACEFSNYMILVELFRHYEHVFKNNIEDNIGNNLLHISAINNDFEIFQFLIEVVGMNPEFKNKKGSAPIHLLIEKQYEGNIVQYLVEKVHVNIESKNTNGETPLHLAAKKSKFLTKYLIETGHANPEAKTNIGMTPLHMACFTSPQNTVYSEFFNNLTIVKYLIEVAKVNPNDKDQEGRTPLMCACYTNKISTVKYLLSLINIDKNAVQSNGWNCLFYACVSGNLDLFKYLINDGHINYKQKDIFDNTILHVACSYWSKNEMESQDEYASIIQFIIKSTDINIQDVNRWKQTPLHNLCEAREISSDNKIDIIKFVLNQNINLEAKDIYEQTCLHTACKHKNLEIVKQLIEKGADKEAKDISGKTPLHIASEKGLYNIVKYLVETAHVNCNPVDKYGSKPIGLARKNNHKQIISYLNKISDDNKL